MCLMCEWYIESCREPECIEKAQGEEKYIGKSLQLFIWKGYSEPCEHIRAEHGPECEMFDPDNRVCNCDLIDGLYKYY